MTFYLIQSILVLAWWVTILFSPRIYAAFQYVDFSKSHFIFFLLPDIVVIAGLSFFAWRRPTNTLKAVIVGAFAYATAWCIVASFSTQSGYLGTALMALGLLANIFALIGNKCFYRKLNSSQSINTAETVIQSAIIWVLFLVIFPFLILKSFNQWPLELNAYFLYSGLFMFAVFSLIGILSAYSLVNAGQGTPLPLNAPHKLVTTGPYKYVRNPMAVAGLGQGLSIAIITRSIEVAAFCVLGMIVWNYLVRPIEEEDLKKTFGEEFLLYSKKVNCWIPFSLA